MDITARLKRKGVNAEYITEFAKDKVYENNQEVFNHQQYLFGKQSFRMGRVRNKVQVMVCDSPLLLNIIYNDDKVLGEDFNQTVLNVFNSYHNKNYLLVRNHTYENEGRLHNEKEAKAIRKKIMDKLDTAASEYRLLKFNDIPSFKILPAISVNYLICTLVAKKLCKRNFCKRYWHRTPP